MKCQKMAVCVLGKMADYIGCRTPDCPPTISHDKNIDIFRVKVDEEKK